jgi:hypothetical protein
MNLVSFKNARQQLLRGFCYFFGVVALHRFFKLARCIHSLASARTDTFWSAAALRRFLKHSKR